MHFNVQIWIGKLEIFTFSVLDFNEELLPLLIMHIISTKSHFNKFQLFNFISQFLNLTFFNLSVHDALAFAEFVRIWPGWKFVDVEVCLEVLVGSDGCVELGQQPLFHSLNRIFRLIIQQINYQRLKNIFYFLFNVLFVYFFEFGSSLLSLF